MGLANILENVVGGLLYTVVVAGVLVAIVSQNIFIRCKKMDWKKYLKHLGGLFWKSHSEEMKAKLAKIAETIEEIEDKIDEEFGYESARPNEKDKV